MIDRRVSLICVAVVAAITGMAIVARHEAALDSRSIIELGVALGFVTDGLLIIVTPTLALLFALPRTDLGRYLGNGFVAVLSIAMTVGFRWHVIDEDVSRFAAFVEGVVFGFVPSVIGLALGGVVIGRRRRR